VSRLPLGSRRVWYLFGVAALLLGTAALTMSGPVGAASSGSSKGTVEIGFELTGNAGANQSSTAGANVNPYSSGMPFAEAIVKWINSHGGLGGKKVVPVYYAHNFTSPTDFQDLCTTFFQDNHIFIDVPFAESPSEYPCFKQNNAILLGASGTTSTFNEYPGNLYGPAAMPTDVYLKNFAIELVKSHWVKKGAKVGMIYANNSDIATAVQKEVIPYLAAHGIHLTDSAEAINILDVASFQEAQLPTQNAVLRFKSEGITQVIIPNWGGYNFLIWLRDAVPQNYFPEYAFSAGVVDGGNVKSYALLSSFPISIYNGSVLFSTGTASEVTPPVNPITLTCKAAYASEGISIPTVPSSSDSSSPVAYTYCYNMMFLKQVFQKGNVTNIATFKKAADSLGTSVQWGGVPSIDMSPSHPYMGADQIQDLAYNGSCACFQITKKFHAVQGY
jgi:hypothetical protein